MYLVVPRCTSLFNFPIFLFLQNLLMNPSFLYNLPTIFPLSSIEKTPCYDSNHIITTRDSILSFFIGMEMDRRKKIQCKVCGRCIRSDNIKRHARTHQDILTMSEDEAREELRRRNDNFLDREEKYQKLEEIAQQEGIDISNCIETQSSPALTQSLEEELLKENQDHLNKLELGKQIAQIINKGTILEESLSRDRKYSLDLYRKQKPSINIRKAHLRVWQQQLLTLVKQPLKRQVYLICGYNGKEGEVMVPRLRRDAIWICKSGTSRSTQQGI